MNKESKIRAVEDFWDTLIRRLRQRQGDVAAKFSVNTVMMYHRQAEIDEAKGKVRVFTTRTEMSDLDLKWVRLGPIMTNPGLKKSRIGHNWAQSDPF